MFHSEYGQDKFVADLLGNKRNGTFVEFGALDGLLHSNTLHFEEELGWTGLLIEANPDAFNRLEKNRPRCSALNVAVYDHVGFAEFEQIDGGLYGWSGINRDFEVGHWSRISLNVPKEARRKIVVPCLPLAQIMDVTKDIDYMSIDVEGAEQKILSVFPFERFNIDVLGVEDNFGNVELDALIQNAGYQFLQKVGPDRMYRRAV